MPVMHGPLSCLNWNTLDDPNPGTTAAAAGKYRRVSVDTLLASSDDLFGS
jgi:hypothetical protein